LENFNLKRGLKTGFSSENGGGGCRKFESFVGNLGGFAPTGKISRHWWWNTHHSSVSRKLFSQLAKRELDMKGSK
jgi:hypothetical protein